MKNNIKIISYTRHTYKNGVFSRTDTLNFDKNIDTKLKALEIINNWNKLAFATYCVSGILYTYSINY